MYEAGQAGASIRSGQGGRGVHLEILSRMQREQPQQAPPIGRKVLIGQAEGEFDAGVQASAAGALVEPVGMVGHRPAGLGPRVAGHQPERERQVAAAIRDPGGGVRIVTGRDPSRCPGQELDGLGRAEHVHREVRHRRRAGQVPPAGDQGETARRRREQRPDLLGVGSVVEEHQGPDAGERLPPLIGRRH
ncbi:hypothetical protein [Actinoplanes sp. NPDC026619]|uniref:hypothetical protein n=1 Tax=Actinoplanes sp. NPDC026619 TaxID=3155798 RepID=UPI0033E8B70C